MKCSCGIYGCKVGRRAKAKDARFVAILLENSKLISALKEIAEGRGYAPGEEPWEVRYARMILKYGYP